jgi:hypothetical protein
MFGEELEHDVVELLGGLFALKHHWVLFPGPAVGAGETSDEWLADFAAFMQHGTLVRSRDSKAIGSGAALDFICSLPRPNR